MRLDLAGRSILGELGGRMNDIELDALVTKVQSLKDRRGVKRRARLERLEKIWSIRVLLDSPKGLLKKRCPKCGQRLSVHEFEAGPYILYVHRECACGYEYVTKHEYSGAE